MQGILNLLRADEVYVAVKTACCQEAPLTSNDFGSRAYDDIYTRLRVWVAGLADLMNATIAQTHIRFVDAAVINDQSVGHNSIHSACSTGDLGLAHAITNDFTTAEFYLLAIGHAIAAIGAFCGQIAFDLNNKIRVSKAYFVTHSWPKHGSVIGAINRCGHYKSPIT
jgi:hypothetical protein